MSAFDFVLILLSFVYALAIAVVLQSAGRLIIERRRVRFSGLLALAMTNAVVTVFICWLAMWDYRDTQGITLYDVTIFFISSVLIYLYCVAVSPEPEAAGEIDMEAFFWAQRRFFWGVNVALIVSFVASTAIYLRTSQPQLFVQQTVSNLPFFLVALGAFLFRDRRLQWVANILILVMSIAWTIAFSSSF